MATHAPLYPKAYILSTKPLEYPALTSHGLINWGRVGVFTIGRTERSDSQTAIQVVSRHLARDMTDQQGSSALAAAADVASAPCR